MPRRSPHHHISHLQRAREEAETERIRKLREEAAEVERLRIVAEEDLRRVRRQQELDEAELRRQRAVGQLHESERQRREIQIEDRLRHLEGQELDGSTEKKSATSRCCKTFKIMFGIGLTLGLVFVV